MAIVKEYYTNQIEMRGPGNPNAKPMETGTVVVLRHDDGRPLTVKKLATLFNAAAKDFPDLEPKNITISEDRISFSEKPVAGYTKLPNKTIGARG